MEGVLSNIEIIKGVEEGTIIIEPFNEKSVNNTSYDVTLGPYFYETDYKKVEFIDITSNDCITSLFGEVKEAEVYTGEFPHSRLKEGDKFIRLKPTQRYLCHTNEFIGGRIGTTTMMKAKSTIGRCGISVCQCAGWGDVGYFNRWTMEVKNHNDVDVILRVGDPVAQIVFFSTNAEAFQYSDKGKYQVSSDLLEIKEKWNPAMMLPLKKA